LKFRPHGDRRHRGTSAIESARIERRSSLIKPRGLPIRNRCLRGGASGRVSTWTPGAQLHGHPEYPFGCRHECATAEQSKTNVPVRAFLP
jgi:hypothetical protein